VIDFDHGAFAKQALDAAVQVSKIIHAARMPRARETGTCIQLCQDSPQRKSPLAFDQRASVLTWSGSSGA
ncbi:hypothetical protein, partial [Serratia marcescens]|uniref:hypothetical protein n=1 Tax=Serratia marcescens TaxID=615 RepID=UPI001C3766B3